MVFQCRIIKPKISFASSRLENSQVSDISPPNTSRLYSLGITVSGPAIRAAKNPSSTSTFIAPPQPLRKSPRRSSSASVRNIFMGNHPLGGQFLSLPNPRYVNSRTPNTHVHSRRHSDKCFDIDLCELAAALSNHHGCGSVVSVKDRKRAIRGLRHQHQRLIKIRGCYFLQNCGDLFLTTQVKIHRKPYFTEHVVGGLVIPPAVSNQSQFFQIALFHRCDVPLQRVGELGKQWPPDTKKETASCGVLVDVAKVWPTD